MLNKKVAAVFGVFALTMSAVGLVIYMQYDDPTPENSTLRHVFELVRHGARAPLIGGKGFPVSEEMLTPMGMRQRYLLGRYNYEKYAHNNSDFLSEISIQSTDLYRTLQSGYSELQGVLAGNTSAQADLTLTENQFNNLNNGTKSLPFKVRRAEQLNEDLGVQAIISGFVKKPIYTYIDSTWDNDADFGTCGYAAAVDNARWTNDSSYTDVMYLKDDMAPYYAIAFNLTEEEEKNMTFFNAYNYADAIYSQRFEGLPQAVNWTDEQIYMINTTQIYALLNPFTDYARELFVSKQLERAIYEITAVLNDKNTSRNATIPYYRVMSSHDTQVANIMKQINPAFNFTYIPYASQVYFEVYQHDDEYFVQTMFNGKAHVIGDCGIEMCPKDTWLEWMNTVLVIDNDTLLHKDCNAVPSSSQIWPDMAKAVMAFGAQFLQA